MLLQLQQQQDTSEPTRITEYRGAPDTPRSTSDHRADTTNEDSRTQNYPPATHLLADIRPSPSPQGPCKTTLTRMDCYDQALM